MNRFTEEQKRDARAAAAAVRENWQALAAVSQAHAEEHRELVEAYERDAERVGDDLTPAQVIFPARQFALRLLDLTDELKETTP